MAGHGVPAALIAETERVSHAFFDLPLEEKMKVGQPARDVLRGYIPVSVESLSRSMGVKAAGDLNKSLMIGEPEPPAGPYFSRESAGNHFFAQSLAGASRGAARSLERIFSRDGAACDRDHAGLRAGA